uniref:Uncharacterized protein n=1 Tax=Brassica campestris TaxID=3711 RepID=A0A3P6ABI8_BRACM|nr:unnamed protein product [Brassica rapa]
MPKLSSLIFRHHIFRRKRRRHDDDFFPFSSRSSHERSKQQQLHASRAYRRETEGNRDERTFFITEAAVWSLTTSGAAVT